MQELPKIVRERLQTTPQLDHPDADVLTAFAEQLLMPAERASVLQHLARCGDCRDVIALALPETPETLPSFTPHRGWLRMPVLRWGAIAAALVIVASVGVIRWRRPGENITARVETYAKPAVETPERSEPVAQNKSQTSDVAEEETARPVTKPGTPASLEARKVREMPSSSLISALTSPQVRAGAALPVPTLSANALKKEQNSTSVAVTGAPPSPPIGQTTETVEVSGGAPQVSTEQSLDQVQSSVALQQSQLAQQSTSNVAQQDQQNYAVVGKAKPALAVPAPSSSPRTSGAVPSLASTSTPAPRWTITSAGGLQRSFDQGRTWQDVVIPNVPAPGTAMEVSALKQKKGISKARASIPSPVIHAISASGAEIWAGASGVLYHSLDAGDHWTEQVPSQGEIYLTGDIVSVQFVDAFNGKVTTSTSETWSTADGGQTWSRQ